MSTAWPSNRKRLQRRRSETRCRRRASSARTSRRRLRAVDGGSTAAIVAVLRPRSQRRPCDDALTRASPLGAGEQLTDGRRRRPADSGAARRRGRGDSGTSTVRSRRSSRVERSVPVRRARRRMARASSRPTPSCETPWLRRGSRGSSFARRRRRAENSTLLTRFDQIHASFVNVPRPTRCAQSLCAVEDSPTRRRRIEPPELRAVGEPGSISMARPRHARATTATAATGRHSDRRTECEARRIPGRLTPAVSAGDRQSGR